MVMINHMWVAVIMRSGRDVGCQVEATQTLLFNCEPADVVSDDVALHGRPLLKVQFIEAVALLRYACPMNSCGVHHSLVDRRCLF